MPRVILDAGHGGSDVGEYYERRSEKNDNLLLALRVGLFLEARGIEVVNTRTADVYLPMLERVSSANRVGGDLLVSLHRLSGNNLGSSPGLDFFVGENDELGENAAKNIGNKLYDSGYEHYGIIVRTDIPLINDTDMPSIIIGIGYIRSANDNNHYDNNFVNIAEEIAEGIYQTFMTSEENVRAWDYKLSVYQYRIGMGPYYDYEAALEQQLVLCRLGYESEIVKSMDRFFLYTNGFENLDEAAAIELRLRRCGCFTFIIKD
jgi:N-acetylmuramoyl-L-alanine amidase